MPKPTLTPYPCPCCKHDCADAGCEIILAAQTDDLDEDVVLCKCGKWRKLESVIQRS